MLDIGKGSMPNQSNVDNTPKKLTVDSRFVGLSKNSHYFRHYSQAKIDLENGKMVDKIINLPPGVAAKKDRIRQIRQRRSHVDVAHQLI